MHVRERPGSSYSVCCTSEMDTTEIFQNCYDNGPRSAGPARRGTSIASR
jgi:hypothetical protein